jgi:multidrug efflux pump subunit AcrA (membrane-fusion protein)
VAPGSPIYETSSLRQEVLIELDPDDLDLVTLGATVTVVLPDDTEVPGEITEIGKVVRRSGFEPDSPEVLDVIVSIDATAFDLERAPVEVEVESDRASGVLAVPVRALVSLSDGGYAVEVRDGDNSRLIGVSIGDFAGGLVEVDGDLAEGDSVVVPAG